MATPAIAGAALLIGQYFRDGFYTSGAANGANARDPSAALVKAILVNSASDIGSQNIPNHDEGFGRVLLEDALYFDGDTRELRVEEDLGGLTTGQTVEYVYEVEAGEAFEVSLVWSDHQATVGAGTAIVNDLDLEVDDPSGNVYKGNRFSAGQSVPGGNFDRSNVMLSLPAATMPRFFIKEG